jgi:Ca2+-binding EF-hand superfamily protein
MFLLDLLRACFAEADVDGDGSITLSEFKNFLDRFGIVLPKEDTFADVFAEYDINRDYVLDFEEFKSFILQTRLLVLQDNTKDGVAEEFGIDESLFRVLAKYFFSKADANGDGLISVEETREVLRDYGFDSRRFREFFEKYDANGDGAIDAREFRGLLVEEGIVRPVERPSKCAIL